MFNRNKVLNVYSHTKLPRYSSKLFNKLKTIRVYSIDLEACFNKAYKNKEHKAFGDVVQANEDCLRHMVDEANKSLVEKIILMVGSTGQCYWGDRNIIKGQAETSFVALTKLHKSMQARTITPTELDPYLLADMYGNKERGYSFHNAIKDSDPENSNFSDHPYAIRDRSKIIILYAQLNKIAAEYKDKFIVFDFYSSSDSTSFTALAKIFKQYPELIPANVTLSLHSYENEKITLLEQIMGKGEIDFNFKENIKKIDNREPDRYDSMMERMHPVDRNFDFEKFLKERKTSLEVPSNAFTWEWKA